MKLIKEKIKKEGAKNKISNTLYYILVILLTILTIIVATTDVCEKIHLNVLNGVIEKNLKRYDLSDNEKFNFIYYSKDTISSEKENIENALSKIDYLRDEMIVNNLKIVITKNSVRDTVEIIGDNLIRIKGYEGNNTIGSYYPGLNLIVISLYNLDNLYSLLSENGEIDYTIEDLLYIADKFNIGTLMHEIGHFLDDISKNSLHINEEFEKAYIKEKDLIFNKEESYYKDSISEYIAECLAYLLSNDLEKSKLSNTKTNNILNSFLDEFKLNIKNKKVGCKNQLFFIFK